MTAREFLELLWRYKPEEHYILIWTLQDKRSHWFQDVVQAAEFVERATGLDRYVGMGLAKENYGPARRCKSEEISGFTGIGSDFDLRSEAHGTKPLPATIADALSVIPSLLPPTLVIFTGNGIHVWWLFKEPYIFDTEEERKDSMRLLARFHNMLAAKAAARGWAYDRLSDLARVLRIPGTENLKDPANPKQVVLHSYEEHFYNLSDIEEFLDEIGIPDPEAEERAARAWSERFHGKPIVVNPGARIPEEKLEAWMRDDMRFRNTWLRQRHDLKDQSNSGYDMALADFGVDAGLPEQLIVDLIIHHRAVHQKKFRSRVDYYQRTIAKAEDRSDVRRASVPLGSAEPASPAAKPAVPDAATATPVAEQGAPVALVEAQAAETTTPKPVDPDAQRTALCARISDALTIEILRLVKIEGKEPQYRMELADGQKIEIQNVNKLLAYEAVRSAIAAAVGRIIPKVKGRRWEEVSQMMLDACVVEQGTEEMEWVGAARMYLQHYLAETGFIPSIEGQRVQEQRKPMIRDGAITICTSDFQVYVNKTTFQNLSVKALAGMLSALGAHTIKVRGGGKFKDQSRWVLPTAEFDPKDYPQQEQMGQPDEVPF